MQNISNHTSIYICFLHTSWPSSLTFCSSDKFLAIIDQRLDGLVRPLKLFFMIMQFFSERRTVCQAFSKLQRFQSHNFIYLHTMLQTNNIWQTPQPIFISGRLPVYVKDLRMRRITELIKPYQENFDTKGPPNILCKKKLFVSVISESSCLWQDPLNF